MSSLKTSLDELVEKIDRGREFGHASYEPIYYLVFPPSKILEMKREMPAFVSRLKNMRWDVEVFSVATEVLEIVQNAPLRDLRVDADRKAPLVWERANEAIKNVLAKGTLKDRLEEKLEQLKNSERTILLVTDLEGLHPFLRIGAIENQLYGKFFVPTVFLYPGERTGKTRLRYLGFYPEDGNYRSVHIGG